MNDPLAPELPDEIEKLWMSIAVYSAEVAQSGKMAPSDDLLASMASVEAIVRAARETKGAEPVLHVGDSDFEDWFGHYAATGAFFRTGCKQIARDAYAAGMGDRAAQ